MVDYEIKYSHEDILPLVDRLNNFKKDITSGYLGFYFIPTKVSRKNSSYILDVLKSPYDPKSLSRTKFLIYVSANDDFKTLKNYPQVVVEGVIRKDGLFLKRANIDKDINFNLDIDSLDELIFGTE